MKRRLRSGCTLVNVIGLSFLKVSSRNGGYISGDSCESGCFIKILEFVGSEMAIDLDGCALVRCERRLLLGHKANEVSKFLLCSMVHP